MSMTRAAEPGGCGSRRPGGRRKSGRGLLVAGMCACQLQLGWIQGAEPILLEDVSHNLDFARQQGGDADGLAGAAWFDFDNDGFLDLFIPNAAGHPNALFRNNQDGTFTDVAIPAGVANGNGNSGAVAGDFNNDGWADLLLTYAGSEPGQAHTRLYLNRGDGGFSDITESAGLSGERSSFSPVLADIDNDGFLDVFLTSLGTAPGLPASQQLRNKLYRNNGDLTFTDVSEILGRQRGFRRLRRDLHRREPGRFPGPARRQLQRRE